MPITNNEYLIKVETPVDEKNRRFYDGIALFDKVHKKITWSYVFDDNTFLGSNDPKISTNKLYQLDNNNTLHIFEKDQNESI